MSAFILWIAAFASWLFLLFVFATGFIVVAFGEFQSSRRAARLTGAKARLAGLFMLLSAPFAVGLATLCGECFVESGIRNVQYVGLIATAVGYALAYHFVNVRAQKQCPECGCTLRTPQASRCIECGTQVI